MKGVAGSPLLDARWSYNPYLVDGAVIIMEVRIRHRVSPLSKRKQSYETRVVDRIFLEFLYLQKIWILDSYFFYDPEIFIQQHQYQSQ